MTLTSFGGRRFLLTLGCGIACTVLVWYGKLDGSIFRDIIIATVGVYIGGNTFQKVGWPGRGAPSVRDDPPA